MAERIPDLTGYDRELHAIATVLHDLGWSTNPAHLSKDKCFEVDGANAARAFIEQQPSISGWDRHRKQLLWDAIALHTNPAVGFHKEPEVKAAGLGIMTDFTGPAATGGALTESEWKQICAEFPRTGFRSKVKDTMCGFCRAKPETTHNSFVGDFGDAFVDGYSRKGKKAFDMILNAPDAD
jgi:hypothetical protein